MIISHNPADGSELSRHQLHGSDEVAALLDQAVHTQQTWAAEPIAARCRLLSRLAKILRRNQAEYARLITQEMGKSIVEAEAEIEKCAWTCDFYAEAAPGFLAERKVDSNASESSVVFAPLGVVLALMPWNFPFW